MKTCCEIEREQVLDMMKAFSQIFDVVRLVEPNETSVLTFDGEKIRRVEQDPCFSVWEKDARCANCVSLRACTEHKRMTKFEFRGEEIYSVVAMPFLVKSGGEQYLVSMELVNHVTDDMVMYTHGTGVLTDKVRKINKKIYEDSLTGVFNRRYYDERLYIYEMTHALPEKIGFLLVDVNKFKYVNDLFGHGKGDDLLVHVADVLKKNIRKTDKVMRFGGDEFLVVLRDCNQEFVGQKLELLKQSVSEISLDWMGEYQPSVAVGMAYTDHFNGSKEQIHELCEEADRNMYQNKNAMREK